MLLVDKERRSRHGKSAQNQGSHPPHPGEAQNQGSHLHLGMGVGEVAQNGLHTFLPGVTIALNQLSIPLLHLVPSLLSILLLSQLCFRPSFPLVLPLMMTHLYPQTCRKFNLHTSCIIGIAGLHCMLLFSCQPIFQYIRTYWPHRRANFSTCDSFTHISAVSQSI